MDVLKQWKVRAFTIVYIHSPRVALSSDDLLAVADATNNCLHLLAKEGALVRSIGKGVLGSDLGGITFDLKGNVWVTDEGNNKVLKLSRDGQLLQTIDHAGSKSDRFNHPTGVSVSPEGLVYICDIVVTLCHCP